MSSETGIFTTIRKRLIATFGLFELFIIFTILYGFNTFLRLETDGRHLNSIQHQIELISSIYTDLLNYLQSDEETFNKKIYKGIAEFDYEIAKLLAISKTEPFSLINIVSGTNHIEILRLFQSETEVWGEFKKSMENTVSTYKALISGEERLYVTMFKLIYTFNQIIEKVDHVNEPDFQYYSDMVEMVRNEVVLSTEFIGGDVLNREDYLIDEDLEHINNGLQRVLKLISQRLESDPTNEKLLDLSISYIKLLEDYQEFRTDILAITVLKEKLGKNFLEIEIFKADLLVDLAGFREKLRRHSRQDILMKKRIDFALLGVAIALIVFFMRFLKIIRTVISSMEEKILDHSKEIDEILNNVSDGLITVSNNRAVNPEYSTAAKEIFELPELKGKPIASLLFDDQDKIEEYDDWLKLFFEKEGMMSKDNILMMGDDEVVINRNGREKIIELDYRLIYDNQGDRVKKVMFITNDVTEKKELKLRSEKERKEHEMVVRILRNQDSFFTFISNSWKIIDHTRMSLKKLCGNTPLVGELFRGMHNMKGRAASFLLNDIASAAHSVENILDEIREDASKISPDKLDQIQQRLDTLPSELDRVVESMSKLIGQSFGPRHKVLKIKVSKFEHFSSRLKKLTQDSPNREQIVSEVRDLLKIPVGRAFLILRDMPTTLAAQLGKKIHPVEIQGGDLEIDDSVAKALHDPLTHIIRNSVDHGIEEPETRKLFGKQEYGTISLQVVLGESICTITIKDDGAGIDSEVIKEIAIEKNLISAIEADRLPQKELINFIFYPGFSSSKNVTDISGRGVGMDVVKNSIENLAGTIEIQSTLGIGTTIILSFPVS